MHRRQRVAGVSFYQDAVKQCFIGERVELVPEPTNPADKDAIAIMANGRLIGYIPRVETADYHPLIADGRIRGATVHKLEDYEMDDERTIITVSIRVDYGAAPEIIDAAMASPRFRLKEALEEPADVSWYNPRRLFRRRRS